MTIAREGEPVIFSVMFVSAILLGSGFALQSTIITIFGFIGLTLTVVCFLFFREPEFRAQCEDWQILSGADGTVIEVDDRIPDDLAGYAKRVSVFLSLFDVHINRIPASGRIDSARFLQGRRFSAFKQRASVENQRSEIELTTPYGRIHFRQIAGSVARRVVFDLKQGQMVDAGQRFGVMRFGSRIDHFFPENVNILVSKGDKVKGGKTVIGEFER